jgi:hypothetical protein
MRVKSPGSAQPSSYKNQSTATPKKAQTRREQSKNREGKGKGKGNVNTRQESGRIEKWHFSFALYLLHKTADR